jgi:hypothetical protein
MLNRPINDEMGATAFVHDGAVTSNKLQLVYDVIVDYDIKATVGLRVVCDTRVAPITITTPDNPTEGDKFRILDRYNSFPEQSPVISSGGAEHIDGTYDDFTVTKGMITDFIFSSGEGWKSSAFVSESIDVVDESDIVLTSIKELNDKYQDDTQKAIAQFDFSANGNYVLDGLNLFYVKDDEPNENHIFSLENGKARVNGFPVNFYSDETAEITFANDIESVTSEGSSFTGDGEYSIRWTPVAAVTQVNGIKEAVDITMSHGGYAGCSDLVPYTPLVQIMSSTVKQGETTFVEGTDYVRFNDSIDWSPAGNEPAPGSQYTMTVRYQSDVPATITADRKSIIVNGLATGTIFHVDYDFYLNRIDRLVLNVNATMTVIKGIPDKLAPEAPKVASGLTLASVKLSYGSTPIINRDYVTTTLMSDAQAMRNDIRDVQYNLAQLSLKDNAGAMDPTTTKKGIVVDAFDDDDMRDMGYPQNAMIISKMLAGNIDWITETVREEGGPITLPYTEETMINITAYTTTHKVLPYAWDGPPPPVLKLIPRSYTWLSKRIFTQSWHWGGWGRSYAFNRNYKTVDNTAVINIPQRTIAYEGSGFNGNETVKIVFDKIDVEPATSDADGNLSGTFTIPADCVQGKKLVTFTGEESDVEGFQDLNCTAYIVRTHRYNIKRRPRPRVTRRKRCDPIAQTFEPPRSLFATSVAITFTSIPTHVVTVMLCETQVGIPDTEAVIATKELNPEDCNKNIPTVFSIPPTFVEEMGYYAFVVETADANLEVRTARMGMWDSIARKWVNGNPYGQGVLLESSNITTWSPIQNTDMTFQINNAQFSLNSVVDIGTVDGTSDVTDIMLTAEVDNYPGTGTKFTAILLDRNNETYTTPPGVPIVIPKYSGDIKFEVELFSNNADFSPVVDEVVTVALGTVEFPSNYIDRRFSVEGVKLKNYLVINEPSGSSVKMYYDKENLSLTDGASDLWTQSTTNSLEYYFTGNTLDAKKPDKITIDDVEISEGTVGSLEVNEWAYDDNDTIGTEKLYIRITGDADPDTLLEDAIKANAFLEMTRDSGNAIPQGEGDVDMPFTAEGLDQNDCRIQIELETSDNIYRPYAKNKRITITD